MRFYIPNFVSTQKEYKGQGTYKPSKTNCLLIIDLERGKRNHAMDIEHLNEYGRKKYF